jgi:DNA-binding NtrC family response regulator
MKIAIVDDEQDMRQSISQWLTLSGFETETYPSAEDALKSIGSDFPGVVVTDVKMPGHGRREFLKRLMAQDSGLPVIMITGHGDVPMAVDAMRIGAFDFLEKPFNPDKMTELAKKASQQRRMTLDNRALRRELSDGKAVMKKLIGSSPEMERLREDILDLGQADSHVLIDGETGTGKTLVAHALHAVGPRAEEVHHAVVLRVGRTAAWREAFRPRSGRGAAPGGGGARRHAVSRGYRGAAQRVAGAASDLHQRAGNPAPDPDHRDLQRTHAGKTLEDSAAPRPVLPARR